MMPSNTDDSLSALDADGCAIARDVVTGDTLERIAERADELLVASDKARTAGMRNLLRDDEILHGAATRGTLAAPNFPPAWTGNFRCA